MIHFVFSKYYIVRGDAFTIPGDYVLRGIHDGVSTSSTHHSEDLIKSLVTRWPKEMGKKIECWGELGIGNMWHREKPHVRWSVLS